MENYSEAEKEKWDAALQILKNEIMPDPYTNMIEPLRLVSVDTNEGIVCLQTKPGLSTDLLSANYTAPIESALKETFQQNLQVIFSTGDETVSPNPAAKHSETGSMDKHPKLNNNYTFESYVTGSNNELAFAACLSVAKGPIAVQTNPLFIYGNAGLGKTHLMHAIGHYAIQKDPGHRILYITSEEFTNELVSALQNRTMPEFREKYRNIDILMIDDIQFIEKKDRTQEELFHTFNTLYDSNHQIVFTSDRPPKDIATIDQRLNSRFEWGLTVDIQPPDFETRVAILRKKAEMDGHVIDDNMLDVINYIAEKVTTNIRELEGALSGVLMRTKLVGKPLNRQTTEEALRNSYNTHERVIDIPLIKNTVCAHFGINVQDIDSSKRTKTIVRPRQIAMYLCRELTDVSLPKIGENFGKRDHTTVMHACDKIASEIKSNEETKRIIEELTRNIRDI